MSEIRNGIRTDKMVGRFQIAIYWGSPTCASVVRAWDVGEHPTIIRQNQYPSWQIYEGDYDEAKRVFDALTDEFEVDRRCDPMKRNPRLTRSEDIEEFRRRYPTIMRNLEGDASGRTNRR